MRNCPRCHVILATAGEDYVPHMKRHIEMDVSAAIFNAAAGMRELGVKEWRFAKPTRLKFRECRMGKGKNLEKVKCPVCDWEGETDYANEDWATCPNCDMPTKYWKMVVRQKAETERLSAEVLRLQDDLADARDSGYKAEVERLRKALSIDREDVGRIMHESWTRTKRSQGFHHPSEPCTNPYIKCGTLSLPGNCGMQHPDLVPWDKLPEAQKDINRHAFDDVLEELRRRAGEGQK